MFNLKHGIIKKLLSTLTILSLLINHAVFANSVAQSQRMLNQLGYNAGPVDGAYVRPNVRLRHSMLKAVGHMTVNLIQMKS